MPETTWSDTDVATAAKLNQIEDQIIVTCTSSTRPTGTEGRMIFETDTNKKMIHDGSTWQLDGGSKWNSFTPSYTNLSVGNGTSQGLWRYLDGGIRVRQHITFGSTTSISGSVSFTIPNSETASATFSVLGNCMFFDSTTGKNWQGSSQASGSGTSISLFAGDDNIDATNPAAYGTSDTINTDITIPL